MMNEKTELVFILDRSGSMGGLEKDTIGGFNAMLDKQRLVEGQCLITTVLFDNNYHLLHDRIDIRAVRPMTERDYQVGGSTALLDAIGATISKISAVQKQSQEEFQAGKVMFVIITDGEENASREYGLETIRKLIGQHKDQFGWEFIFLGANIDAVASAAHLGIRADRAQNFHADSEGMGLNFRVMNQAVENYRQGTLPEDWNDDLEADYNKRKK